MTHFIKNSDIESLDGVFYQFKCPCCKQWQSNECSWNESDHIYCYMCETHIQVLED